MDGSIRFGNIAALAAVNGSSTERDPFASVDELTLYFYTNRGGTVGGADVYMATRSNTSQNFGGVTRFASASTDASESKMSMTDDGLYLVVTSNKNGTNGTDDLLDATRTATSQPFSSPLGRTYTALEGTALEELDGFVTPDGLDLYLAQTILGFQHIMHATRTSRGMTFGSPVMVTEIDSGVGDADPTVSADGRVILYSSNRTDAGKQSSNIWYATRADPTGVFGTPHPVPDINSDSADGDAWLSHDGCRMYFSTDRGGDYDIWGAVSQ